jgi:hypothetical protein
MLNIGMHMSLNGQEHMYTSIDWFHDLKSLSFILHGCLYCLEMENVNIFV